ARALLLKREYSRPTSGIEPPHINLLTAATGGLSTGFMRPRLSSPRPARCRRQQQVLNCLARRRPACRDPGLCRSHRDPPGRRDRPRASPPLRPHYVPVLARKPGALRNGALPTSLERVRRKLKAPTTATARWSKCCPGA